MEPTTLETTQDQPAAQRSRWIRAVVIVHVLFVICILIWWYWPRGDTRFVGKWDLGAPYGEEHLYLVLKSDGTGFDVAGDTQHSVNKYDWWVADDRIFLRQLRDEPWKARLLDAVDRLLRRPNSRVSGMSIEQSEAGFIRFKNQKVWTRVPE